MVAVRRHMQGISPDGADLPGADPSVESFELQAATSNCEKNITVSQT